MVAVLAPLMGAGCGPGSEGAAVLSPGLGLGTPKEISRIVDRSRLGMALAAAGIRLPVGSNVYAVILDREAPARRFDVYEAGGGSKSIDFWPASSVKLLAAVGALAFLKTMGFTGAATVTYASGGTAYVRSLYRSAVVDSSNDAYDSLVEIAGVEWLNNVFLSAQNGFPETVIQRSYTYAGVISSPAMTVREGSRELSLPARDTAGGYGVAASGNRSNLAELTDSVRRVVLHGSLPAQERFAIEAVDALELEQDLLAAEGFFEPAVARAVDPRALVYDKPGYVPGDDCVDVAYIDDLDRPEAFLLGVSTPDDGPACLSLVEVARGTLAFLGSL
ncbi:MAG: hypothetical protein ACRD2W_11095 [Acidimicrobiales bacterium]